MNKEKEKMEMKYVKIMWITVFAMSLVILSAGIMQARAYQVDTTEEINADDGIPEYGEDDIVETTELPEKVREEKTEDMDYEDTELPKDTYMV